MDMIVAEEVRIARTVRLGGLPGGTSDYLRGGCDRGG
jgi:hypothetical protein